MFSSLVFPGILQAGPVEAIQIDTHVRGKVFASMTVEKPVDQQGASITSNETDLVSLYEQYRRPIHSYTYRLLGNLEDADDVTQEVFVRACSYWNGLYEREHLSAWLYRIATNLCVDQLRRRKRISWWLLSRRQRENDQGENGSNDDIESLLSDAGGIPEIAERELIRLTLANMPEEYAIALILNAAQGVPYQEIAKIVGISPNAAATRISRAKKMFSEQYQRLNKDGVGKQEKRK